MKLETAQNLVGQQHERDFHMIFHSKKSQKKLVSEHYERDFDMIFHVKKAQNFAAKRYEIDFDKFFLIMAA